MKSFDYLVAESGLLLDAILFVGDYADIIDVSLKFEVRISFGAMCLFSWLLYYSLFVGGFF